MNIRERKESRMNPQMSDLDSGCMKTLLTRKGILAIGGKGKERWCSVGESVVVIVIGSYVYGSQKGVDMKKIWYPMAYSIDSWAQMQLLEEILLKRKEVHYRALENTMLKRQQNKIRLQRGLGRSREQEEKPSSYGTLLSVKQKTTNTII